VKGNTTIERCAAAAGVFTETEAGRFSPKKYHPPPAIRMSNAAIPAAVGASVERFFGSGGFGSIAGFGWAAWPTSSE